MELPRIVRCAAGPLALCIALIAGCTSDNPAALVRSAKEYVAKRDYPAAWIQLRNALQKQPENAEAHYLIANLLAQFGDYAGAENEYRAALKLGHPAEEVYPGLARAMVKLARFSQVVSELGQASLKDSAAQAAVLTSVGEAQLALKQPKPARQSFAAALERQPGLPRARIGQARLLATEGDLPAATKAVDDVLAQAPNVPEALTLKADLLQAQGKPDEAADVLSRLTKLTPQDGQARFALVSNLVGANKLDQAAAEVTAWRKALPRDIRGNYFEAVLAMRRGDWRRAREASLQVLKEAPDHAPSLAIAGTAEFNLGSYTLAEDYFRKVLARHPEQLYARNLLVATYLRKGQPAKAEETLAPALKQAPKEPAVLRTAGEVAMAQGRLGEAARYYGEAVALEREDVSLQVRLAQVRLALGETDRALADLQSAAAHDPGSYQADLALVAAHLGRREYDKALGAVAGLEKKQPDNPLTHDLKGSIYMAKRDPTTARASFEKALSLQFNYLPAARNLARLDLMEGKGEAAKSRFATIVEKEPNNDSALLGLAQMQMATPTAVKEIAATLDRAVRANATSAPARLALIEFVSRTADARVALNAAQAASAALPDNAQVLEALGIAQLRAGETYQAIGTFNNLARVVPDSPVPLLRIAEAEFAAKRHDAAVQALRKALSIRADLPQTLLDVALIQVAAGRPGEALKEAQAVQKARPKEAIGFAIEGDVLATQKKFTPAAAAYGEGLKRQPVGLLVVKQHQMLRSAGAPAEADALVRRWLKDHPRDAVVRFHLADTALRNKDYRDAARGYRELLDLQPDSVAVLNNLAWTLGELKDPSALDYARRAHAMAPTTPTVQDTLGWLLFNSGDRENGLGLLTQAAAMGPRSPDIRLHLAKALIASGDKASAKRQLETAIELAGSSPLKAEAERLLASL